ncbi:MAG TPA: c-type cytochrome, partial [Gemmatimonadaceae bacterium]|nr:c-type cytochrome [Gemmatimonadaceae bacterium]
MISGKHTLLHLIVAAAFTIPLANRASAQERPAKRVADIVGVALAEYEKGIDSSGRLVSQLEYDEAVAFLVNARTAAQRLSGTGGDSARVALDSISAGVARRSPPRTLDPWRDMFLAALGADAALDMPATAVDLAAGDRLYAQHCASCHGVRGLGDGPAGKGLNPPPPALGSAEVMRDVPPSLMYRIVSVGIEGTAMPGFSSTLSPDERWNIVSYLNGLRAGDSGIIATGEGVWLQRCASCHGVAGESNGPMSASLSKLPRELASFAWQAERSDAQIAAAIRDGILGTAMPAARDLSALELNGLVAWVRTMSLDDAPGA